MNERDICKELSKFPETSIRLNLLKTRLCQASWVTAIVVIGSADDRPSIFFYNF